VTPITYPIAKRIVDKLVGMLLLLLLSPLILFALALIAADMLAKREHRGPFFYRERRITAGREFGLLKFRVLRNAAIAQIKPGEYARLYEAEPANLTRAGRLLKAMYLDELPQIFNILRGDMSLVGPRPWPLPMVEKQIARGVDYRRQVVAGWTGPAQVRKDGPGRHQATELDLDYVEALRTWPGLRIVWFDLKTLFESVKTMLRRRGVTY
jgi:lipopolysaccharide/colanic/teichoic acid biosynthesis glycosyltransferase